MNLQVLNWSFKVIKYDLVQSLHSNILFLSDLCCYIKDKLWWSSNSFPFADQIITFYLGEILYLATHSSNI
jgi:hypothetical protein